MPETTDINTGRQRAGGEGTFPSSLIFGGYTPSNTANTEAWNGSSWTEVNNLNTARNGNSSAGASSTDGLYFGGTPSSATEEFVSPTTNTVTFTAS